MNTHLHTIQNIKDIFLSLFDIKLIFPQTKIICKFMSEEQYIRLDFNGLDESYTGIIVL